MNQRLSQLVKSGLRAAGVYRSALADAVFPGVAILTYHAIRSDSLPDGSMAFENLHVRASTFAEHCAVIRELCDPIALDDWRAALGGGPPLPPRPVLITFDDGYRSVFTTAAPILASLDLPASVFVCSGPSQNRAMLWFDAVAASLGEPAVESWKARDHTDWLAVRPSRAVDDDDPRALMTPFEIGALSRQPGIEIGGHTVTHPILSRAGVAEQRAEVADNRDAIESWTGRPVRAFAYPNGRPGLDYSQETVAILRDTGFDCAFTTRSGFAFPHENVFERSRFTVVAEVTATELAHRFAYSWRS